MTAAIILPGATYAAIEAASARVRAAEAAVDRNRHAPDPSAVRELARAMAAYFATVEEAMGRGEGEAVSVRQS